MRRRRTDAIWTDPSDAAQRAATEWELVLRLRRLFEVRPETFVELALGDDGSDPVMSLQLRAAAREAIAANPRNPALLVQAAKLFAWYGQDAVAEAFMRRAQELDSAAPRRGSVGVGGKPPSV